MERIMDLRRLLGLAALAAASLSGQSLDIGKALDGFLLPTDEREAQAICFSVFAKSFGVRSAHFEVEGGPPLLRSAAATAKVQELVMTYPSAAKDLEPLGHCVKATRPTASQTGHGGGIHWHRPKKGRHTAQRLWSAPTFPLFACIGTSMKGIPPQRTTRILPQKTDKLGHSWGHLTNRYWMQSFSKPFWICSHLHRGGYGFRSSRFLRGKASWGGILTT
jgi:hypothetical protein